MSKKRKGALYKLPIWLEFGTYDKKEFKKRGNNEVVLIDDFLKYIQEKYNKDYKNFQDWLHGKKKKD